MSFGDEAHRIAELRLVVCHRPALVQPKYVGEQTRCIPNISEYDGVCHRVMACRVIDNFIQLTFGDVHSLIYIARRGHMWKRCKAGSASTSVPGPTHSPQGDTGRQRSVSRQIASIYGRFGLSPKSGRR